MELRFKRIINFILVIKTMNIFHFLNKTNLITER
jgi:hypothetical protein